MGKTQQKLLPHDLDKELVFSCEICIEPTSKKFKNGNKCFHLLCSACMIKYIRVKLIDDNAYHIKCPAIDCDHALDPLVCASLLDDAPLFLRWSDMLCEAAIDGRDKRYCPFQNCNVLIVNECGGKPRKSECPSCKGLFCFQCARVWHAGFKCEENDELRDENDVALGKLAEHKGWIRCPRCRQFVDKRWGCSSVKCRCGIIFCYNCGKRRRCGQQVHDNCCRCDDNSMSCALWCYGIFLVLAMFLMMCDSFRRGI